MLPERDCQPTYPHPRATTTSTREREGRCAGLCPGGAGLNANMQRIKTGTTYHLRRRAAHRKAVTAVPTPPWVQHTKEFSACSLKRSCHSETAGSEKHTAKDGHGSNGTGTSFMVKPPLEHPLFPGPGTSLLAFQRPGRLAGRNTPARATHRSSTPEEPQFKATRHPP